MNVGELIAITTTRPFAPSFATVIVTVVTLLETIGFCVVTLVTVNRGVL